MLDYLKDLCVSMRIDGETYTAVLKPEYAVNGERVIKADAKKAYAGKWVTINGAHVLIGKNGLVVAGAGGKFNGMNMGDGVRKIHKARGIVNAAEKLKKLNQELGVARSSFNHYRDEINKWQEYLKVRLRTYGKDHRLTKDAEWKVGFLKKESRPFAKELKSAEAKVNAIKKKYPGIDEIIKQRNVVQQRRALRQWARSRGIDPDQPEWVLGNLRDRESYYKKGHSGGVWTGDGADLRGDMTC